MLLFITFPSKPSKENWIAKHCVTPFKSWQLPENVSASPNDPSSLVWEKKKSGFFRNNCATIFHHYFGINSRLVFWCFQKFHFNLWKAAPMQTASSRGPLKRQPQTGPSEYFQGKIHFSSSYSCCPVLYFLLRSPVQICCALYNRRLPLTDEQSVICACEKTHLGCFAVKEATGGQN